LYLFANFGNKNKNGLKTISDSDRQVECLLFFTNCFNNLEKVQNPDDRVARLFEPMDGALDLL
jgi:hypothetical protein